MKEELEKEEAQRVLQFLKKPEGVKYLQEKISAVMGQDAQQVYLVKNSTGDRTRSNPTVDETSLGAWTAGSTI